MISPIDKDGSPVEYPIYSTCDIETRRNGFLLAVSLFYDETYEVYNDWGDWLNRVIKLSKKKKTLRKIWAHNGANFDWQHLIEFIISNRPDIKPEARMSKSTGVSVILRVDGLKFLIYLYDSYRLLPKSLMDLSHDLGVETTKISIDVHPEDLYQTDPVKFYEYLQADTIALSQVLNKAQHIINDFITESNPVRYMKSTVASQAKDIWRREFLKHEIYVPNKKGFKEFERKSYHGGLVLCPNHGIYEDCMGVDRVSMYPSEMAKILLPTSYRHSKTKKYRPGIPGLYRVEYDTKDTKFPFIFNEDNQIRVSGTAVITNLEYDYILAIGGTVKLDYGYVFKDYDYLLRGYALKLFELKAKAKKEGHKALETIAKLFMNSIYGKFGQSDIVSSMRVMNYDEFSQAVKEGKSVHQVGIMTVITEKSKSVDSFVTVASMITAAARISLMKVVRANYDTALYTDTDSVFVRGTIQGVKLGENLGDWSVEWEHAQLTLVGRKTYAVVGENKGKPFTKIRTKGISLPKRRTQEETQAIVNRLQLCASDIYHKEPFTFTSAPTNHDVFIKGKKSAMWQEHIRNIQATSDLAQRERGIQLAMETLQAEEKQVYERIRLETKREFRNAILNNGGISPYKDGYWKEEMSIIPVNLKRLTGLPLDQMTEILSRDYPQFGIETENQLLEYIETHYKNDSQR